MMNNRGGLRLITRLLTVLMICSVILPLLPVFSRDVSADGYINLSIQTTAESPNPGDIVTVTVTADNLPHITRFGPIEFNYDDNKTEFVSCQPSPDLVNYIYTSDNSVPGKVLITSVDEMSEAMIEEAVEIGGEDAVLSDDPSFYSSGPVILFSVSFRVLSDAAGVMAFSLGDVGPFIDSLENEVEAGKPGSLFITIAEAISGNSTLSGLSIPGVALTPVFDPSVTEYSAAVGRNVTSVDVNTIASNAMASVVISGNANLQVGENVITINVTSQDGNSTTEYKIYLNRQEDTLPEDAGVVDAYGKAFSFVNLPPDPYLPEGFVQTTRIINGYTVPVYEKDGVLSVIVYLYDGENSPGFYFYNPANNTVMPYNPGEAIIKMSRVLTVSTVPSNVSIPDGLTPATRQIGDVQIQGYTNDDGDFICYLRDESGVRDFYLYDEQSGDFIDYRPTDLTAERIYHIMFIVFLVVSVIEAVMIIVILFIIRKVIIVRSRPRPRRV